MDTTKEYIEMCTKSDELKKIFVLLNGDEEIYIHYKGKNLLNCSTWCSINWYYENCSMNKEDFIWLPRQDQLQQLITDKGYFRFSLIQNFYRFTFKWINFLKSMEQLWLAYVMDIKFHKYWDGENWI